MGAAGFGPEDERRSRLPAMWLIKCYARLTRPYKKNVSSPVSHCATVGSISDVPVAELNEISRAMLPF
jgi:hypothetical protein